jgi:biopolymer transport protein ExbB
MDQLLLFAEIDKAEIIGAVGHYTCYPLEVYLILMGTFYSVLLFRRVKQKKFPTLEASREFLETIRGYLKTEKYEDAIKHCESPANSRIAVPQLVALAVKNRKEPLSRIKRDLVVKFESDIIASLDRYLSYIFTYTRMGPLAGLYGTVVSMIAAFARMGSAGETRVDPGRLAGDISLALWATAIGLLIATPLTLVGNMINVRIRTLEDESQEVLGRFMEDFEKSPIVVRQKMAAAARQA